MVTGNAMQATEERKPLNSQAYLPEAPMEENNDQQGSKGTINDIILTCQW